MTALPPYDLAMDEMSVALSYITTITPMAPAPAPAPVVAAPAKKQDKKEKKAAKKVCRCSNSFK